MYVAGCKCAWPSRCIGWHVSFVQVAAPPAEQVNHVTKPLQGVVFFMERLPQLAEGHIPLLYLGLIRVVGISLKEKTVAFVLKSGILQTSRT